MAVTVGSDVYISVADATAYCASLGLTAWASAILANQEIALRRATQYLDTYFRWGGRKEDPEQPLSWPRLYAYDTEGYALEGIPTVVAHATAELAVMALNGDLAPLSAAGDRAVKREKIGQVDVEYEGGYGRHSYDKVVMMLRGIGSFSGNVTTVKVVRA